MKSEALQKIVWPGKIKILDGYVFRACKPAICGVEVLAGRIRKNYRLMNKNGEVVGEIREIQKEKEKVEEAGVGDQLAISCDSMYIGKNVAESELLYTYMNEDELKKWDEQQSMLNEHEKAIFQEMKKILRKYF
jgi:translation initiation factor 5B